MLNVKIILVGESCVGRTAIIDQYINHSFKEMNCITVGYDKSIKEINIKGNKKLNKYSRIQCEINKYKW